MCVYIYILSCIYIYTHTETYIHTYVSFDISSSPNDAPIVMFTPEKYWSEWKEVLGKKSKACKF